MEQNMQNFKCPQCGKQLLIPQELEEFSCLYCGARLRASALRQPKPDAQTAGDLAAASAALVPCIVDYRGYQKKITREQFVPAFAEYEAGCADALERFSSAVMAAENPQTCLQHAADALLDALEATWCRRGMQEDDKFLIAIFFVPLLRKKKLPVSEDFAACLQAAWVARWPKTPFYLGDYEDIAGGFRKKFLGLCFITTAVCRELGKPDDCPELTAFRAFRDGYLAAQPDGPALIREYYRIAPAIVTCIDLCTEHTVRYRQLREEYLSPCYDDLLHGRQAQCKRRYVRMVRALEREFLGREGQ